MLAHENGKRIFLLLAREIVDHFDSASMLARKFRRITPLRFATRKKLANRVLFGAEYLVEAGVITRLE